jgi:peptidylprolyl isomerase
VIPGFEKQGGDGATTAPRVEQAQPQGGILGQAACPRRVLDGAHQNQPDTNSQFFIVFDDARFLDKRYTVWGEVTAWTWSTLAR